MASCCLHRENALKLQCILISYIIRIGDCHGQVEIWFWTNTLKTQIDDCWPQLQQTCEPLCIIFIVTNSAYNINILSVWILVNTAAFVVQFLNSYCYRLAAAAAEDTKENRKWAHNNNHNGILILIQCRDCSMYLPVVE